MVILLPEMGMCFCFSTVGLEGNRFHWEYIYIYILFVPGNIMKWKSLLLLDGSLDNLLLETSRMESPVGPMESDKPFFSKGVNSQQQQDMFDLFIACDKLCT